MLDKLFKLSQNFITTHDKEYVRYFLRTNDFKHRLSILIGPRGIGKTTTILQYIKSQYNDLFSSKVLYVQADHFLVVNHSLYEIAQEFYNNGGELLCIDEIHKYKNWSMELKSIYDTFVNLKIIATGSSALEIHKGSHDLSRRAIVYNMFGMSFREFIELSLGIKIDSFSLDEILTNHQKLCHNIIQNVESTKNKIIPLFKRYLKIGYYPYFMDFDDEELFFITLEQNIHTTIENDLLAIYPLLTGNSVKKIISLLAFISSSVPFTPDLKKLKNIIGIGDERTLKNYLKYLEDASLIKMLEKSSKGLDSIEKPEKIYLANTNLLNINGCNSGTMRETFFLNTISSTYKIISSNKGDFLVDNKYIFEIGGKNKDFNQIKDLQNSFLAIDDIESGFGNKIPLWLFGFLY